MRRMLLAMMLALPAAADGATPSATPGPDGADAPALSTCLIKPRQVVQVGSPVAGLLSDELVDRGERVARGQVIARMESSVEQADLALDRLKAGNDTAIQAETADLAMAQRMAARKRILVQQQDANESAMDELDTKVREGVLRLQQAQMDQRLAQLTALRTARQLDLKQIRAPTDGVVMERKMSVGEFVYEQTPIMTIAQVDPLSVELIMPGARYGAVKIGAAARVRPDAPVGGEYAATVDVVDPVIDAASNTFGVRLMLPNPQGAIPAGLHCTVRLLDGAGHPIPTDPPPTALSGAP